VALAQSAARPVGGLVAFSPAPAPPAAGGPRRYDHEGDRRRD
jgi:hypothetical protein